MREVVSSTPGTCDGKEDDGDGDGENNVRKSTQHQHSKCSTSGHTNSPVQCEDYEPVTVTVFTLE